MNFASVEAVVRRLFADADFREQAVRDPSGALAEYQLGDAEREALTSLCGKLSAGPAEAVEKQYKYWW